MSRVKYQLISKQGDINDSEEEYNFEESPKDNLLNKEIEISVVPEFRNKVSVFPFLIGTAIGVLLYLTVIYLNLNLQPVKNYWKASSWKPLNLDSIEAITNQKTDPRTEDLLFDEVRIVCIIVDKTYNKLSTEEVQKTWGQRCNKLVFANIENDTTISSHAGNENLGIIKNAFSDSFSRDINDGEWFLKAKYDTYVIMQNLREMLSNYNYNDPIIFGQQYASANYLADGAMILSKESLRKLVQESFPNKNKCQDGNKGNNSGDIELHNCIESVGIKQIDTRDEKQRGRIFQEDVEISLFPTHERNDDLYYWFKLKQGIESCCSDKPISFHGLKQSKLYLYDYLINTVRAFGTEK